MYKLTNHRKNKTIMIPNRNISDASDNDMFVKECYSNFVFKIFSIYLHR